ncbi:MAG: response regulator [Bdellovibrionales bacterium]|nr:response regulator [Bdellovibrionales bacterium]
MALRLLFVDDEENILSGLRRTLRAYRSEWDMDFASGGEEALRYLAQQSYDVVITDMRMPKIDGADLLHRVHETSPQTFRIILSGQAEEEAVYRAIPVAHQYLTKPCQGEDLASRIMRLQQAREAIVDTRLLAACTSLDCVPCLPRHLDELSAMLDQQDADEQRLVRLLSRDSWLVAKLLQLVNSSFFGHAKEVRDADKAISMLGLERVRRLVKDPAIFHPCGPKDSFCALSNGVAARLTLEPGPVRDYFLALWNIPQDALLPSTTGDVL